jgi:hypothetical protein
MCSQSHDVDGGQRRGEPLAGFADIEAVGLVVADHGIGALELAGDLVIEPLGGFLHRSRGGILPMLGEESNYCCVPRE